MIMDTNIFVLQQSLRIAIFEKYLGGKASDNKDKDSKADTDTSSVSEVED